MRGALARSGLGARCGVWGLPRETLALIDQRLPDIDHSCCDTGWNLRGFGQIWGEVDKPRGGVDEFRPALARDRVIWRDVGQRMPTIPIVPVARDRRS